MPFSLQSFTGGFTSTNGFLLQAAPDRAVVIDAPEGMADWLDSLEIRPEALLLTHAHFDHVMDAHEIQTRFQCPLFAYAPCSPDLTLETLLADFGMPVTLAPYTVDECLEGRKELVVGAWRFDLFHVPGHSPDSLCFRPHDRTERDESIVLGGDVLFQRGIGRTDFPHSDHEALIRGIATILYALPEETMVFPGHGPWTTIGTEKAENPFVSGEG